MAAEIRGLPRRARETVTLETPQRLAMVSSVGFTVEGKQKATRSASLLVKQRLVLKRFLLGGSGQMKWVVLDPTSLRAPDDVGGELRRASI